MAKRRALRLGAVFFVAMVALTFVSWRLDGLRTPYVSCVAPESGQLADGKGIRTHYDAVIPLEALQGSEDQRFVYLVEETGRFFSPVVARRVDVLLLAQEEGRAAVSNVFTSGARIVRFASRPLMGDAVPVKKWEGYP